MESKIATGTNDSLLDALDFRLPDVANYIVDRTSCTFFPQGGNQYAPNGVRLIRFVLADNSQFIDSAAAAAAASGRESRHKNVAASRERANR